MTHNKALHSHADTLRGMANGPHPGLSHSAVVALIAGAEALDARDRVRAVLIFLEEKWKEASEEWHGKFDLYQKARAETLHDTIHILTEVLEGDTE